MHIYDTLLIGSGYTSTGYAIRNKNTIICQPHQICDTSFYLPLRSFQHQPYTPKTEEGARLFHIFQALSLFKNGQQNTNGFECALCQYIIETELNVLLKCRVISTSQRPDGIYDVTIHSNEGLTHLFARNILNTQNSSAGNRFTLLFLCENIETAKKQLLATFPGSQIEPAFYPGRYALRIPVANTDVNRIKKDVYDKWCSSEIDAKILYMAPMFCRNTCANELCDDCYNNPIEAFEAGYFYAKEAAL